MSKLGKEFGKPELIIPSTTAVAFGEYHIFHEKISTGEQLSPPSHGLNKVVLLGKENLLRGVVDLSPTAFNYMGASPCVTAADVVQTNLLYEHIGDATRPLVTSTTPSGGGYAALSASDLADESTTVGGVAVDKKLTMQAIWLGTGGNLGKTFRSYGLFSTATLPGTTTGTSGIMFSRFVDTIDRVLADTDQRIRLIYILRS